MEIILGTNELSVSFKKEGLLTSSDWFWLNRVYKVKNYTVLYNGKSHIYINPDTEGCQRISEIIPVLFKQKYLNRKTEKFFDEFRELTDGETEGCLMMMWDEWREKVKKSELHDQAESILKQMRSRRLYYKARKNKEIIYELFNIGFGGYDKGARADYREGAEYAFMYGYLLGSESSGISARRKGD